MPKRPTIPNITPTIDLSASAYVESVKNSALAKQGIASGPIEIQSEPGTDSSPTGAAEPKNPLILIPFDDGTVLKYLPRQEGSEQQIVVTAKGDQVAITRDASCAALITDGVNVLMRALDQKQAIENENSSRDMVARTLAETEKSSRIAAKGCVLMDVPVHMPPGKNAHSEMLNAAVVYTATADSGAGYEETMAAVDRVEKAAVAYAATQDLVAASEAGASNPFVPEPTVEAPIKLGEEGISEAWTGLADAAHLFVATGDRSILARAASAWCQTPK